MGELPTFDVLLEYVVDDGVYILVYVLEEEGEAVLDGQLQLLQEVMVVKRTHLSYKTKLVLEGTHKSYYTTWKKFKISFVYFLVLSFSTPTDSRRINRSS